MTQPRRELFWQVVRVALIGAAVMALFGVCLGAAMNPATPATRAARASQAAPR